MDTLDQALYHWAPRVRYEEIARDGLKIYSESPCTFTLPESEEEVCLARPYICLSHRPSLAWMLSVDMDWGEDVGVWDLWEVWLDNNDQVHVRSENGYLVYEVRVYNSVPSNRCWWVGIRDGVHPPAIEKKVKRPGGKKRGGKKA